VQRSGKFDWTMMVLGLPIGIAIGVSMDNVLMGIPIGLMFGIAFASAGSTRSKDKEGDAPDGRAGS
jgi:hypothetical protein